MLRIGGVLLPAGSSAGSRQPGRLHRLFSISTPLGYSSVYEMGENYGPGYRVFYGIVGRKIILLRAGSTKKDQNRAIAKAPNTYISAPAAMIAKSSASWGAY